MVEVVYTVCCESADELTECWQAMWSTAFPSLEAAMAAVRNDLENELGQDTGPVQFIQSEHRDSCWILDNIERSGLVYTIMKTKARPVI